MTSVCYIIEQKKFEYKIRLREETYHFLFGCYVHISPETFFPDKQTHTHIIIINDRSDRSRKFNDYSH